MRTLIAIATAAAYILTAIGSSQAPVQAWPGTQAAEAVVSCGEEALEPEENPVEREAPPAEETIPEAEDDPAWYLPDIPLSRELQAFTYELCSQKGVPYTLVLGVMYVESRFRTDALRKGGTADMVGIMQINSRYLPSHYKKYGVTNAYEPEDNITIGIGMLADFTQRSGTVYGLMEYNMGGVNMRRLREQGVTHTGYTDKVLKAKAEYDQSMG